MQPIPALPRLGDESVSPITGDTGTTDRWDSTAQQYIDKTDRAFWGLCPFIRPSLDDGTTHRVDVGDSELRKEGARHRPTGHRPREHDVRLSRAVS